MTKSKWTTEKFLRLLKEDELVSKATEQCYKELEAEKELFLKNGTIDFRKNAAIPPYVKTPIKINALNEFLNKLPFYILLFSFLGSIIAITMHHLIQSLIKYFIVG